MNAPHVPVLIDPILEICAPIRGTWIDGTLGAGGYARALLEAGARRLVGIDRDPLAHELAAGWGAPYGGRLTTHVATFDEMDHISPDADGVVLDLGVSSMQLDRPERGFSFMRDGPLDMRMGADGPTAAELVADADETELAAILKAYGEERQARRIARAIVRERAAAPIETTAHLAAVVAAELPRSKPGQPHPATRSFQAIRIAVNDELGALARGLEAAERALKPDGRLAVVTFHSLEDRIVKRFIAARAGATRANRHSPEASGPPPAFEPVTRKAVRPSEAEIAANPRARSAKLRVARRTRAPAGHVDPRALGLPLAGRA